MASNEIEIFCYIIGNPTSFSITVLPSMSLGKLKRKIREDTPALGGFGLSELQLWIVSLADDEDLPLSAEKWIRENNKPTPSSIPINTCLDLNATGIVQVLVKKPDDCEWSSCVGTSAPLANISASFSSFILCHDSPGYLKSQQSSR